MFYFQAQEKKNGIRTRGKPTDSQKISTDGKPTTSPTTSPTDGSKPSNPRILNQKKKKNPNLIY